MKTNTKPIYEFLLWDNCGNNCSFCFQNSKRNALSLEQKKDSIQKCIEFLNSDRFVKNSHALLMGGEIFDNIDIADDMIKLFDLVVEKMLNNDIDILYITTNLIYKRIFLLYYLLEKIEYNNLFDRFKMATSYDIAGRFTPKTRDLMLHNLMTVRSEFPKCNITVNTMLSKQACEAILNNTFDVVAFEKQYDVYVHLIPYIILDDSLTATREQIFTALAVVDSQHKDYIKNYINNFDCNQDKRLYKYDSKTQQYVFCSCEHMKCGHSLNFTKYSNNRTCYICDLKDMFNG